MGGYLLEANNQIFSILCFIFFIITWQQLANSGLKAKSRLPFVSVSKVLLEHEHAHLLLYYVWLPWRSSVAEVETGSQS